MKPAEEWLNELNSTPIVLDEGWVRFIKAIQLDASNSQPDDEQPITEEWLLSVGFDDVSVDDGFTILHHDGFGNICQETKTWRLLNHIHISITTRRHVRLLAELLGVTLNEQSK